MPNDTTASVTTAPGLAKNISSPGFTLHTVNGTIPSVGESVEMPMPSGVPATSIVTVVGITTGETMCPANDACDPAWRWRVHIRQQANVIHVESPVTAVSAAGEPFSVTLIVRD